MEATGTVGADCATTGAGGLTASVTAGVGDLGEIDAGTAPGIPKDPGGLSPAGGRLVGGLSTGGGTGAPETGGAEGATGTAEGDPTGTGLGGSLSGGSFTGPAEAGGVGGFESLTFLK